MKTNISVHATGILLVTAVATLGQPTISSLRLSGQPQTSSDSIHLYLSNSVSLGANITFTATANGTAPLSYQWQFKQRDLPDQTNRTLILTNMQLTNAGDYTIVVTNGTGATNLTTTLAVDTTFTKVTTGSVVTDPGLSSGGAWADYNNDGFLDLFVPNGDGDGTQFNYLYRNNGDGSFTKIGPGPLPVNLSADWLSACWGDYNNDGLIDLFLGGLEMRSLYLNNGDSTFTQIRTGGIIGDITSQLGSLGCAWVDYNNDGFLDLFVTTFDHSFSTGANNYLYRNNGDNTFTKITNSLTVPGPGFFACAWGDYDNDGYPDVFVSGQYGNNALYHNNGDGTFSQVTTAGISPDVGHHSGGCAWGDYDNDGFLDLFVANGTGWGSEPSLLYHNKGNGTFTRITNGIVAADTGKSISCAWGDYDNDGFLDLLVTNEGDPSVVPTVVNFLYHNNRDGTFSKVTTGSLANEYSDSFGCSWADYDNDGFLDLFVARGDNRGNFLYHNNGNTNNWITVKPVGTVSNRSAIGAKVRVEAVIWGVRQRQLREICGGNGSNGQSALWANFGLGDATNIDLLRIEWPSGIVNTLTNVAPKQILTVVEHQSPGATIRPNFTSISRSTDAAVNISVVGDTGLFYLFEGSSNLINWTWLGVRSNAVGTVQFTDLRATHYPSQFYRVSIP